MLSANGNGISPNISKVFESQFKKGCEENEVVFISTDTETFGLNVTLKFIELSGAMLYFRPKMPTGSRFRLHFSKLDFETEEP